MSVNENLKTAFYTSVSFALKGKEKIEESAKEFAAKNKLSAEEGEKFVKDIVAGLEKKHNHAQDFIKEKVKNAVAELGLVTRKEFDDLQAKYDELKAQIDAK